MQRPTVPQLKGVSSATPTKAARTPLGGVNVNVSNPKTPGPGFLKPIMRPPMSAVKEAPRTPREAALMTAERMRGSPGLW